MAKDVAAFANATGGALIIGAKEGATEPDYSNPLDLAYAAKLEDWFDQAVRDFCRPSPSVHIRVIPTPTAPDGVIVVVNVEASVEQPIAARHETEVNMWRFPLRIGRHTEYILPEKLPLFMDSKARRAKLLLLRALEAGGHIDLFTVPSGLFRRGDMQAPGRFIVEAVDTAGGGAFVVHHADGDFGEQSVAIPIDDVEAVWLQHSGRWAVRLSGRMEQFQALDGSMSIELAYVPPTTFVVSPLEKVAGDLSKNVRDIGRVLSGTLVVQQHGRMEPTHDAIAHYAYRLWELREKLGRPGNAESDWYQARKQLLRESRED